MILKSQTQLIGGEKTMNKKLVKFKVTRKIQEEINKVRKKCGQKEELIKPDYELKALFG